MFVLASNTAEGRCFAAKLYSRRLAARDEADWNANVAVVKADLMSRIMDMDFARKRDLVRDVYLGFLKTRACGKIDEEAIRDVLRVICATAEVIGVPALDPQTGFIEELLIHPARWDAFARLAALLVNAVEVDSMADIEKLRTVSPEGTRLRTLQAVFCHLAALRVGYLLGDRFVGPEK